MYTNVLFYDLGDITILLKVLLKNIDVWADYKTLFQLSNCSDKF